MSASFLPLQLGTQQRSFNPSLQPMPEESVVCITISLFLHAGSPGAVGACAQTPPACWHTEFPSEAGAKHFPFAVLTAGALQTHRPASQVPHGCGAPGSALHSMAVAQLSTPGDDAPSAPSVPASPLAPLPIGCVLPPQAPEQVQATTKASAANVRWLK